MLSEVTNYFGTKPYDQNPKQGNRRGNMIIQDLVFFNEIIAAELTNVTGGVSIPVDTTNQIKKGRATIRVDLRDGLKDEDFSGSFEDCIAEFDDFTGLLDISCYLSPDDVNGGIVLYDELLEQ